MGTVLRDTYEFVEGMGAWLMGEESATEKREKKEAEIKGQAAADARVRQAEYEKQAAMGTERTKSKRRRGFQSTVLTGGQPTLGGGYADSGKTLLGG